MREGGGDADKKTEQERPFFLRGILVIPSSINVRMRHPGGLQLPDLKLERVVPENGSWG